jgi:Cu(I)/Ag(I) efflux system membrane fusion protein
MEGEYVEEGARLYDVVDLSVVWIQAQVYEEDLALLREGMPVSATTLAFPNKEFTGKVAFIQPHLDQNTRTITVRLDINNPNHDLRPGMYATVKLQVSASQLDLLASNATEEEKQFLQKGQALAVPEGAVIDTGNRKIVYRQASPGVFEGVEVWLGPRMVGLEGVTFYPVIRGLRAGDQIVGTGSFLIDAETRLSPAAGSIYFGGGSKESLSAAKQIRPSTPPDRDTQEATDKSAPKE